MLAYINTHESATVAALCSEIGASPATIHRDLEELAAEKLIVRVRGGALAVDPKDDPPIAMESRRNLDAKRAIAARAAELVGEESTIFLEASSTVRALAPLLRQIRGLTVVTNGPEIALDLLRHGPEVVLIGGALRERTRATVGPMAIAELQSLRFDIAFMGISAIDPDGVSSMNMTEAETKVAIMAAAKKVIGLADRSKLGKRGLTQVCTIDHLDLLISDASPEDEELIALTAAGLTVDGV